MNVAVRRRGQPLAALVAIVVLWVGGRALLWETPFPASGSLNQVVERLLVEADPQQGRIAPIPGQMASAGLSILAIQAEQSAPLPRAAAGGIGGMAQGIAAGRPTVPARLDTTMPNLGAVSLLAAPPAAAGPPAWRVLPSQGKRWAGDAWLFARSGSGARLAPAAGAPTYGASQAGATLRYRLNEGNPASPTAYLRVSTVLDGADERELAAGIAAQPLANVPIVAMAEARVLETAGRASIRPAVMLVSQVPSIAAGPRGRIEGYVQAGYVGGDFATVFVDGQARVAGKLADLPKGAMYIGPAAWGGAQRGAARLDLGPSATLEMRLGDTNARLAIDYRFRAAGDAQPGSGPAITLSTGF